MEKAAVEESMELLEGRALPTDQAAGTLPYGMQRRLEIAGPYP